MLTVPPLSNLLIRQESSNGNGRALRRCPSVVPHAESRANANYCAEERRRPGSVGAYNKTLNPTATDHHTKPATQIAQRRFRHWCLSLPPATRSSVVVCPCRVNMLVTRPLAAYSLSRGLECWLPFLAVLDGGVGKEDKPLVSSGMGGRTKPRSPRAHKC